MTRIWLPLLGIAALAACQQRVPDLAGVGFRDYATYQREALAREAQLQTPLRISPEATGAPTGSNGGTADAISAAELREAGIDISPDTRVLVNGAQRYGPTPEQARTREGPVTVVPVPPEAAVSSQSPQPAPVQSGAAPAADPGPPLSALRPDVSGFALVSQPPTGAQPAPAPRASTGPDIVAFALQTDHPVGQQAYRRVFPLEAKMRRACLRHGSPDLAQRAFLAAGGPERDRLGLDPDGDGYACNWDPTPYRAARRG